MQIIRCRYSKLEILIGHSTGTNLFSKNREENDACNETYESMDLFAPEIKECKWKSLCIYMHFIINNLLTFYR